MSKQSQNTVLPHAKKPVVYPKKVSFLAVLRARCPRCREGKVMQGFFGIAPRCTECDYNFYPESGFYLGAMVVGFFLAAALTVPPMIALKVSNVEMDVLLTFPFVEFLFLGPFLMVYSKLFWLHLEYALSRRLD